MSHGSQDDVTGMRRMVEVDGEVEGPDMIEEGGVLDLDQAREVIPYTYEMTAYGADYPVDALVSRLTSGDISIPVFGHTIPGSPGQTGFQRGFVWTRPQADKFIESLLLGLPVPGIFLVKEPSGVLLVLDGHQRLRTLQCFYDGLFAGKEYRLNKVQARFSQLRYKDLIPDDRRRLDNSIIHATVVRQDIPDDGNSSIYLIFERLNSGGTVLQPQEIRVALYAGPFANLLNKLNDNADWRQLYGIKSKRFKDMELILRFLGLYYHAIDYKRPMKGFLNNYMAKNKNVAGKTETSLELLFDKTCRTILEHLGHRAFKPATAINAAVLDSVMVGVARRIKKSLITDTAAMSTAYQGLLRDQEYLLATSRATADEEHVKVRLKKATMAFATVG